MMLSGLFDSLDVPIVAVLVLMAGWIVLPALAFFGGMAFQRYLMNKERDVE